MTDQAVMAAQRHCNLLYASVDNACPYLLSRPESRRALIEAAGDIWGAAAALIAIVWEGGRRLRPNPPRLRAVRGPVPHRLRGRRV
jgi:hypothetical protein